VNDLREFWEWALKLEEPWKISDIAYRDVEGEEEVHIYLDVPRRSLVKCPECGMLCKVHDRMKDRTWRDVDMRGMRTFIHADVPRSDCTEHGVRQTNAPWARPGSGFTLLMESMVLSMVRQMPVKTVGDLLHEYPGRIWTLVRVYSKKLVEGLDLSGVRRVAVDEKCFSGRDEFITVFVDIDTGKIIFVAEGKDAAVVKEFRTFLREHRGGSENITDFSCDFGKTFVHAIRKYFPNSRITADCFHLVKLANEALNDTKCGELKLTVNRMRAKYLLLRNPARMTEEDLALKDKICQDNEVLGIAYRLKESLCSVYMMGDAYLAEEHLKGWMRWARMANMYHFVKLAGTVEKHIAHILQWFTSRITNAVMEGTNSMISVIKSRARGFRHVRSLISMCYLVSAQENTDMYGRGV
jgi:transposase